MSSRTAPVLDLEALNPVVEDPSRPAAIPAPWATVGVLINDLGASGITYLEMPLNALERGMGLIKQVREGLSEVTTPALLIYGDSDQIVEKANGPFVLERIASADKRLLLLIRYEISDSLRLAPGPCPCGRPFAVADGIQGRAEEILRFPAAAVGEVRVHPVVIHQVMDAAPAAAWQVIQEPGRLRVLVAGARPSFDPGLVTAGLHQALKLHEAAVPEIVVEHVTAIPRGRSGKALLIKPLPQPSRLAA